MVGSQLAPRALPATQHGSGSSSSSSSNGYNAGQFGTARPIVLGAAKILMLGLSQVGYTAAAPILSTLKKDIHDLPEDHDDAPMWLYLVTAMVLVLLGGAFAGLTIALMGQDGIYLQVIATSGEGAEKKHAAKVHDLLQKGKHWVLVTLLLSNVIVNETLPIILDRSLGGGWPAVLGSTVLIVIFGEVIPQSVCVRYGLQIGAFMAPCVLGLMWIMAPVAWPTAKLLDWMLGEDHGTVYKKSGLKTLVTLHKTLGTSPGDRLNEDEVAIISAVLDLKAKPIGNIMTPMEDVFTMSADTVLDEKTMDVILSAGYSRIPIYEPANENNFVGMLLVKILITYDPEDAKKVSEFALATLPETRPETSCLDIVNFFQEGKSHMVLVSEYPGENYGAIGVVTLEDVIEELIGEEIIDETDVFIDVHKAIRRLAPAPKSRVAKGQVIDAAEIVESSNNGDLIEFEDDRPKDHPETAKPELLKRVSMAETGREASPKATFMRRSSSGADHVNLRGTAADMREHLKHLGPSNLASRPKTTRFNTVKIKPARGIISPGQPTSSSGMERIIEQTADHPVSVDPGSIVEEPYTDNPLGGGEGAGLLSNAGMAASDGVQALHQGYGTLERTRSISSQKSSRSKDSPSTNKKSSSPVRPSSRKLERAAIQSTRGESAEIGDDITSLRSPSSSPPARLKRGTARSGSITEHVVDSTNGIRKVVLETTSSTDDDAFESHNGDHSGVGQNSKAGKSSTSLLSGIRDGIMGVSRDFGSSSHNNNSSNATTAVAEEEEEDDEEEVSSSNGSSSKGSEGGSGGAGAPKAEHNKASDGGMNKGGAQNVSDVKKKPKKKGKKSKGKAGKGPTGYMFGQ